MFDQAGRQLDFGGPTLQGESTGKHDSPVTLVTFVYTRCLAICRTSASGQAWLQQQLRERGLQDRVRLLTLSFDPARDTPAALWAYARTLRADPAI